MIIINLLPEALRPIKRTPLPYILSIGFFIALMLGAGLVFLGVRGRVSTTLDDLNARKTELATLEPIVKESNELTDKKLGLQTKITTIQEILSDRIIWSQQLHSLASLTPDNIWYSRIRTTSQTASQSTIKLDPKTGDPVVNPKTGEVQYERVRVKQPILEISGYVVTDAQGNNNIFPLTERTSQDEAFSSQFTFIRPWLQDTEFEGFPVRGFTLEYVIGTGDGA